MMSDALDLVIGAAGDASERSLPELERVIERGIQTFVEVGRALQEIRDRRLYRETHTTFEAYCRERWGRTRQYAGRQIQAAQVAVAMVPIGTKPACEWEARAMLNSLPPDEREQVRKGIAMPETVQKMAEAVPQTPAPGGGGRSRIPGVGQPQSASFTKVMDRIFDQMRGMTLALSSCNCSAFEADEQELSDLTACIRALVRLRKHLEEPTHDR